MANQTFDVRTYSSDGVSAIVLADRNRTEFAICTTAGDRDRHQRLRSQFKARVDDFHRDGQQHMQADIFRDVPGEQTAGVTEITATSLSMAAYQAAQQEFGAVKFDTSIGRVSSAQLVPPAPGAIGQI